LVTQIPAVHARQPDADLPRTDHTEDLPGLRRELAEFNGHDDHGHLLVVYPPKVVVSALLNSLNAISTRRLRPEYTCRVNTHPGHSHFWSPS
jgi:REP element-mobilizing transposase RayT